MYSIVHVNIHYCGLSEERVVGEAIRQSFTSIIHTTSSNPFSVKPGVVASRRYSTQVNEEPQQARQKPRYTDHGGACNLLRARIPHSAINYRTQNDAVSGYAYAPSSVPTTPFR
ncbi:unnamed protein product, partial [Ectocarpus sp. 12 AP-2014]